MKRIIFLSFVLLVAAAISFADTITLKSGKEVEGKILERTLDSVKIQAYGVEMVYFSDEIDKINGESVKAPPVQSSPELGIGGKYSIIVPSTEREEDGAPVSTKRIKPMPRPPDEKMSSFLLKAVISLVAIPALVIFSIYLYFSICLLTIAAKVQKRPLFFAWVPVLNFILMLNIASLHYAWLLGFFAAAGLLFFSLPAGIVVFLLFNGFIWYKIALSRNKPGWLGILAGIPLIGLIFIGYLAFSK